MQYYFRLFLSVLFVYASFSLSAQDNTAQLSNDFKKDSTGSLNLRINYIKHSSAEKTDLVGGNNLTGYSKTKILELLGGPNRTEQGAAQGAIIYIYDVGRTEGTSLEVIFKNEVVVQVLYDLGD